MNRKLLPRLLIALAGVAALVLIGYAGVSYTSMDGIARWSYDVPFRWRGHIDVSEARIIYMDDKSADNLQQGIVWDRSLHARLLDKLRQDGARAVFFDVVFTGASADPATDTAFAAAMQAHGNVFIGGALDISTEGRQYVEKITPPAASFRRAAAGWGLLVFRPIDPDYGVRQIYMGTDQKASAVWVAAQKLGLALPDTEEERANTRWLNYYGPQGWIRNISYMSALSPTDTPPGFFKDKIVFVGGRSSMGPLSLGKDEFATPYVRWRDAERNESNFSPGVEVHATALLNLLRGECLTRLPIRDEQRLVIVCGILFGVLFSVLRPRAAVITGILSAVALTGTAFWLMWENHLWFSWMVPVGFQIPIGLTWSLGANYFLETRRRSALRRAFGHYLSPQMADRISNSEFDLRPGGKVVSKVSPPSRSRSEIPKNFLIS
jgi:adenylate cyclase